MKAALAAAAAIALAAVARADSWRPLPDRRIVSPDGRHYALLPAEGDALRFEILARAPTAAALDPATRQRDRVGRTDSPPLVAEPGDRPVSSGTLPFAPYDVLLTNGGEKLVLVERWGGVGYGTAVAVLAPDGRVTSSARLPDLFDPATIEGFTHTVSSIWWLEGAFVSETARAVVLVAAGDLLRTVALDGDAVATPPKEILLDAIRGGGDSERRLALEVASRLLPEGLADAVRPLVREASIPLATRVRAAVAMAAAGDARGRDVVLAAARKGVAKEAREYAVAHLSLFLATDECLEALRDAMRGEAGDAWHAAQVAFRSMGEKAVPTLVAMLRDTRETPDHRGGAAHVLRDIGSPAALDALLEAIADPSDYVANAACNAAIAIGGPRVATALAAHLANGTTQDGRIAMYFTDEPTSAALPAIEKAIARGSKENFVAGRLESARIACSSPRARGVEKTERE